MMSFKTQILNNKVIDAPPAGSRSSESPTDVNLLTLFGYLFQSAVWLAEGIFVLSNNAVVVLGGTLQKLLAVPPSMHCTKIVCPSLKVCLALESLTNASGTPPTALPYLMSPTVSAAIQYNVPGFHWLP